MRYMAAFLVGLLILVAGSDSVAAEQNSVATAPPSVVKTVPQSGDTKVDPKTKEIRVSFSKDMMDKSWSWCTADEGQFPEMVLCRSFASRVLRKLLKYVPWTKMPVHCSCRLDGFCLLLLSCGVDAVDRNALWVKASARDSTARIRSPLRPPGRRRSPTGHSVRESPADPVGPTARA